MLLIISAYPMLVIVGTVFFPVSGKFLALLRIKELGDELLQKSKASNLESSVSQSHIGDTATRII
jgi:hypothetical protein